MEVNTIFRANSNPILDTRTCGVEFEDRSMSTYSEIFIVESMYTKCNN